MKHLQYNRRRSSIVTLFSICSLFIIILCSCNSTTSTSAHSSPTVAPTPTPLPTSTPTQSSRAIILGQDDWPTYHHDMLRGGYVPTMLDPKKLSQSWHVQLDGAVYAEPLVVQGHVLAVTENDSLYSLDAQTGHIQWRTTVGTPVSRSTLPCGNIDPLGITSTPVYDPKTNLLFAVAEIEGPSHRPDQYPPHH
jgi:hypothetical protein